MIYWILVLIIIIIICLIYQYKYKIVENYDARIPCSNFGQCAKFCRDIANCYGFGYDHKNSICYPSQYPIFGRPIYSLYKDQYSYYTPVCNKIDPIIEPTKNPTFDQRRMNSFYVCSESRGVQPQYYLMSNNEFINVGEGVNPDGIFDIDKYEVKPFTWPRNKFDYTQIDLLQKERENQLLAPQNITDINNISKNTSCEICSKPNLLHKKKKDVIVKYIPNDNYNKGQFSREYQCVKNIPPDNCFKYCSFDPKCKGVEWNPNYKGIPNVCCPYREIGELVERDMDSKYGKFYEKVIC